MTNHFEELCSIVGEDYVSSDISELVSYASDPMPYDLRPENIPDFVVIPENTDEISEIVQYANNHKIPLVIHGSGTSLHGSARPKEKGILMSTKRLNDIDVNEEYMYVECGGGAVCEEVDEMLEKNGYFLPMSPGSERSATIGGLVCANTVGHMIDSCYGKPINWVIGLEVVLPNGSVIETGTDSLRRPAGIDFTHLFVGSEGLFGIITKVKIELIPQPEKKYVVGFYNNVKDIGKAWMNIYRDKDVPLPLYGEYLDEKAAEKGFEKQNLENPCGPISISTVVGDSEKSAEINAKKIVENFENCNARKAYIIEDGEKREKIWNARDYLGFLQSGEFADRGFDMTVAVPYLADAMVELKKVPERVTIFSDLDYYTMAHVGALQLHGSFIIPKGMSDEKRRKGTKEAWEVEKELYMKYEGAGGEWGQMSYRVPFFKEKYGEKSYEFLKKIKKSFDPNNIINRGDMEGRI